MLKSTYKPSPNAPPPLPPGWSEHKAPTGHTYYYNAATKASTYTRPVASGDGGGAGFASASMSGPPPPPPQQQQHHAYTHPQPLTMNLSDPRVANAYMAQYNQPPSTTGWGSGHDGTGGGGGGRGGRGRGRGRGPQPADKPMSKVEIPGCEPWVLVYTKYGRRFAYNPAKGASYWRIPDKLQAGILELDRARIRAKAGLGAEEKEEAKTVEPTDVGMDGAEQEQEEEEKKDPQDTGHDYDSSEYEEVEVTDDEDGDEGDDGQGRATKRQRINGETGMLEENDDDDDNDNNGQPVEFDEADIAFQLQAMGQDYGLEQGEYDDGRMDEWPEGAEGLELSEEDAKALFKDLLNDFRINPYSPWEKLIEEGKVIDDSRYTVLSTMKDRRDVWDEWSREKIQELKEQRAKQERRDPKMPYLALLQEKATPKLYWPEFKRKYKREPAMKDMALPDKDKEKLYREHINRLKLPQATLKSDLAALLKSASASQLNSETLPTHLPPSIVTDLRYISLDATTRDALVEAYIQTLPPPPEDGEAAEQDEALQKAQELRRRREKALQDRERAVEAEKRRQDKRLQYSKALLRDEERELQAAMEVSKKGLQSQLAQHKEGTA
ncbi:hypothetical protein BD289DRAFT_376844 [Coniella lustricola]|uniref:WW domain-containing protein n=1 Tax=Coniella lustricola TaxID=2025994 RepID=A0A2T2ZWE0_9PEZI|nr:hypothetical protein BD289DRAFT_376844 [Coniella lustricola]